MQSPSTPASLSKAEQWAGENQRLLELIGLARCGDTTAFEELYNLTARWLLSHVRRLVDDGEAEDVLAEVYLQVWRGLASYDAARAAPAVWLAMIARSRALDHLRRRQRVALMHEGAAREASLHVQEPQGPEQLLSRSQRENLLRLSLHSGVLSSDERTVLGLAYFRELTQQEIADRTGLALGTVKTMLVRAQDKLRNFLLAARPDRPQLPHERP